VAKRGVDVPILGSFLGGAGDPQTRVPAGDVGIVEGGRVCELHRTPSVASKHHEPMGCACPATGLVGKGHPEPISTDSARDVSPGDIWSLVEDRVTRQPAREAAWAPGRGQRPSPPVLCQEHRARPVPKRRNGTPFDLSAELDVRTRLQRLLHETKPPRAGQCTGGARGAGRERGNAARACRAPGPWGAHRAPSDTRTGGGGTRGRDSSEGAEV